MCILRSNIVAALLSLLCILNNASAEEPFSLKESIKSIGQTQIALFTTPVRIRPSSGVFVYSHGMTSRAIYHTNLLKAVYDAGYDIIAYDLPGHGDSEHTLGLRGGVRGLDQMLSVLEGVVQEGKNTFETKKVIMSGWSLGGLVTTIYLQRNPNEAQSAVLYAPGISLALVHGDMSILAGIKTEKLVHDEQMADKLRNDETFFRFPPPCLLKAVLKGELQADPKQYATNTLLFTAGQDYFVSTPNVLSFYEEAAKVRGSNLQSYHFQESFHDLENDVDSISVLKITVDFLNQIK